jgi:hypothetical protein
VLVCQPAVDGDDAPTEKDEAYFMQMKENPSIKDKIPSQIR